MANVKSQILNPITGRAKFNFLDDGTLYDAITGKTVGIIVGDQLISAITGEAIASVVSDNNGNIDLSFITATEEDILKGKVGADVNGNPIEGTLVPQSTGYDINANIDSLNTELSQLTGKESIAANAEEIQDFNDELDTINNELSNVKGE
jgi:hypothetical protein